MAIAFRAATSVSGGTSTSITFDNTANALGIVADDILFAFFTLEIGTAETITTPAGSWTRITNFFNVAQPIWHQVYWLRATGAGAASYQFSWTSSTWRAGTLAVFSGITTAATIIDQTGATSTGFGATLTGTGLTPSVSPTMLIGFFGGQNGGGFTMTGGTPLTEATGGDGGTTTIGYLALPTTAATGDKTCTQPAADQWAVQMLNFLDPAASAGGRTTRNTRAHNLGMGLGMDLWSPDV